VLRRNPLLCSVGRRTTEHRRGFLRRRVRGGGGGEAEAGTGTGKLLPLLLPHRGKEANQEKIMQLAALRQHEIIKGNLLEGGG